jgi:hypothetical protein
MADLGSQLHLNMPNEHPCCVLLAKLVLRERREAAYTRSRKHLSFRPEYPWQSGPEVGELYTDSEHNGATTLLEGLRAWGNR